MGLSFSCPLSDFDDLDKRFEAVLVRSLSLGSGDVRTALRTLSFNGHDSKPTRMKTCASEEMIFGRSLGFEEERQLETMLSFKTPTASMEDQVFARLMSSNNWDISDELRTLNSMRKRNSHLEISIEDHHRHNAALKLQKVYKSFRTRRQLADCAVLVEQRWYTAFSPSLCSNIFVSSLYIFRL